MFFALHIAQNLIKEDDKMSIADDAAQTASSAIKEGAEMSVQLIKMVASAIPKIVGGGLDATKAIEEFAGNRKTNGLTSPKSLLRQAAAQNSKMEFANNILSSDVNKIAEKAKQYKIPVSVIGNGEKQSIKYLESNKAEIEQIMQEIIQERVKEAPQAVKAFPVDKSNISAVKDEMEKNGVEVQFTQDSKGQIYCIYPAEEAEKVDAVKQDLKAIQGEVADKAQFSLEENSVEIKDAKLGKSFSLNFDENKPLTKTNVIEAMQENLGYSRSEAEFAANKLCDDLKLDSNKFLHDDKQLSELDSLKVNIKFDSDSVLLKANTFTSVNFKGGENTHIFITNGDKTAALTPAKMSNEDMKKICVNNLGMTQRQADEAVQKAVKINEKINAKKKETTIFRKDGAQTVNIERTSHNSFSVSAGNFNRTFNFDDKDLIPNMCKSIGITEGKAQNILDKAKSQSALSNKIQGGIKKAAGNITNKKDISKGISKGAKR